MSKHCWWLIGILFITPAAAGGTDESITVTASLTPIALDEIGSSITVIDRAEIESRQAVFLGDLLRGIPGLTISRAGSLGSLTQVRVRGAEANQLLVLVDGVAVNDVFAADEIPLELLTSDGIQRIEVVRGPQSGLWGSDALAGVINIITESAARPDGLQAELEAGSFGTARGNAGLAHSLGNARVSVTGSYLDTDGTNASRTGGEEDGASNATAAARIGWKTTERNGGLELLARYTDSEADFDGIDFVTTGLPADADRTTETALGLVSASGHWARSGDGWRHEWRAAHVASDTETFTAAVSDSTTELEKIALSLQSAVRLGAGAGPVAQDLTFAVTHDSRDFTQRGVATPFGDPNQTQEMSTTGAAVEYRARTREGWSFSASARHDSNSEFENATTFRATSSRRIGERGTRLRASVGSGWKAPTFIERFGFFADTFVGNPELEPETSLGWDAGVDIPLAEGSRLELTYFNSRLEDEINGFVFDPKLGVFTAGNESGGSKRQGFELALQASLGERVQVSGSYTYTDATQPNALAGDDEELRRPRHTANASLRYAPRRAPLDLFVNLAHVGSQTDLFFPPFPDPQQTVRLDAYLLAELTARYRITDSVDVFGRVENALDEEYEDVYGFATPGVGGYVGLRYTGSR
jgi:vitamin B12 transporter